MISYFTIPFNLIYKIPTINILLIFLNFVDFENSVKQNFHSRENRAGCLPVNYSCDAENQMINVARTPPPRM